MGQTESKGKVNKPVGNFNNILVSGDTLDYRNRKLLTCSSRSGQPFQVYDMNTMKVLYEVQSEVSEISNEFHCYSAKFSPTKGDYTIFAGSSSPNALRIFEKMKNQYKYVLF